VVEDAAAGGGWGGDAVGMPAAGGGWERVGTADEGCVEGTTRGGSRITRAGLRRTLLYCMTGRANSACYYIGPEFIHSLSSLTIPNNKIPIKKAVTSTWRA